MPKMASSLGGKKCVLCEAEVTDGESTKMDSRNHPLFAGQSISLRKILLQLYTAQYPDDDHASGLNVGSIVSDEDVVCDNCLERLATCHELHMRIQSAEFFMNRALSGG